MVNKKKRNIAIVLIVIAILLIIPLYLHLSFNKCYRDISGLQQLTIYEGAEVDFAEPERPVKNVYLADSGNSMGHVDPAQQDTFYVTGPVDKSRQLSEDEIIYQQLGPGHFGIFYTTRYDSGIQVMWSNGLDKIVKYNHDTFEVIDTLDLPTKNDYSLKFIEDSIDKFNNSYGLGSIFHGLKAAAMFEDLSGIYTLIDSENNYYVGGYRSITVYGDAIEDDPLSDIEIKRTYDVPEEITGKLVGMNMTYDGWIVLATEHGYIITLARDFSEHHTIKLPGSENAHEFKEMGHGWIRNGMAVDDDNSIYIASNETMHKVIWTGEKLSVDEREGAWHVPYSNSRGKGTGATPSLMGFGEEDKFVVITDGDTRMNIVLFWRDEIPEDWEQIEGTPSRRIAGSIPASMGPLDLEKIQSEQSVVINGYGALIVNNEPNRPWWVPERAVQLIQAFFSGREEFQPFGMMKVVWDPLERELKNAWVNIDVSSPNAVPAISQYSDMVYTVGARNGLWTIEGVDWTTGESVFHYIVGDECYNSCYSALMLDDNGDLIYGTIYGKVKIVPNE